VNLLPSPEQQEIIAAAATFLAKELPAPAGAGFDPDLWARMGALGWFGLGLPEEVGGAGYGLVEQVLLSRELGRSLAPGPFLPQLLACQVASPSLLGRLIEGSAVAGLAEPHGVRFRLLDAGAASHLLVVAPAGVALVESAAFSERVSHPGLDPQATVELATLTSPPPAPVEQQELVARGQVLVAAMLVGICEATRDESIAYAKEREQFGRPIGSFQAVKHRCADMAVRAEAAASLTFLAALSLQAGVPEAGQLVTSAKALAGEYAIANSADDIQNHGGTGFTADCRAHLYLARSNVLATVLGAPARLYVDDVR
jgi:alkylation response protein AidB-like acyl-CoA dehydrogenase